MRIKQSDWPRILTKNFDQDMLWNDQMRKHFSNVFIVLCKKQSKSAKYRRIISFHLCSKIRRNYLFEIKINNIIEINSHEQNPNYQKSM